jgi:hypothetical protein
LKNSPLCHCRCTFAPRFSSLWASAPQFLTLTARLFSWFRVPPKSTITSPTSMSALSHSPSAAAATQVLLLQTLQLYTLKHPRGCLYPPLRSGSGSPKWQRWNNQARNPLMCILVHSHSDARNSTVPDMVSPKGTILHSLFCASHAPLSLLSHHHHHPHIVSHPTTSTITFKHHHQQHRR